MCLLNRPQKGPSGLVSALRCIIIRVRTNRDIVCLPACLGRYDDKLTKFEL